MSAVEAPTGYEPTGGAVDEAYDAGGAARPGYADVLAALETASPRAAAEAVAAGIDRDGVVHGAGDSTHLLSLDAVPRVFLADEWARLASGLEQRVRALEAFVADAFGAREAFRAGVVPGDLLDRCPWFEDDVGGLPDHGPRIGVAGPDIVRDARGDLVVLEDNVRTPTLMAFAIAARGLVAGELPGAPRPRPFDSALRDALHELAGDGAAVAILGRDPGNIVWWELEQLSRLTGWPLVGIGELEDRGGRVVLREDGSQIDVLWRRTNEDRLRGDDGRVTDLGSVLLEPLRRGAVRVVNAFGSGVADDKRTYVYAERLVRFYCGEEPLLRSVPAWDLADEQQRAEALERIDELVFKPRDGAGGEGIVLGARASEEELEKLRAEVEADPSAWIAQEPVALSTHPTVVHGRLQPRHVDLRPFIVGGRALPGGLSRFAQGAGELVVNCAQGGGGKDVWVLDGDH
ncbi:MAG TPA: circularly permuted type 2 ATP-grasp protein [Solirubrobacteraceae bacterium]|nr:circularly permuted type 2 ATP-grasp protein [Solirubrobacteraceae bacterium]